MPNIKSLFGIEKSQIKRTCVLTPFLTKGLLDNFQIKKLHRGKPFSSGNNNKSSFTLIHTQIGAPFVGDAVLHLKETQCKNIILFGSCGLVKKNLTNDETSRFDIGSLVTPTECYSLESFSEILEASKEKNKRFNSSLPSKTLLTEFKKLQKSAGASENIAEVKCATFGSFVLEEKYMEYLIKQEIDVMEMECSAFFNAAKHTGKKAIALFYITDILKEQHVFADLKIKDQLKLRSSIKTASQKLIKFSEHL